MAERVFSDQWGDWQRSCYCGEVRPSSVDKELTLAGWVHSRRDHGGGSFFHLRPGRGNSQGGFYPERHTAPQQKGQQNRSEEVNAVRPRLSQRPAEKNKTKISTT